MCIYIHSRRQKNVKHRAAGVLPNNWRSGCWRLRRLRGYHQTRRKNRCKIKAFLEKRDSNRLF